MKKIVLLLIFIFASTICYAQKVDIEALNFVNDMVEKYAWRSSLKIEVKSQDMYFHRGDNIYKITAKGINPILEFEDTNMLCGSRDISDTKTASRAMFCARDGYYFTNTSNGRKTECIDVYLSLDIRHKNLPRIKKAYRYLTTSCGATIPRF